MTVLLSRRDYPPVLTPDVLYAGLAALQPGDVVPPRFYILDYADDTIPEWCIHSNEQSGPLHILVAFDMSNQYQRGSKYSRHDRSLVQAGLFDQEIRTSAVRILSSRHKTLRCFPVEYTGEWPNSLCDMLQQARITCKQLARKSSKSRGV